MTSEDRRPIKQPPGAEVEDEIRTLLDETRQRAERYGSAKYELESGLGMRLSAIEQALIRLARAIDENSAPDENQSCD
jgi:hypothetical protein